MLIQMQPRQAAVGPDVAFGWGLFRVIEGSDGHVDAARAQVSHQCQLRPAVTTEKARRLAKTRNAPDFPPAIERSMPAL